MNLFVYGTLMVPEVMFAVCGYRERGIAARIDGFRRYRVAGESYPAIIRQADDSVTGLVYHDVSPGQVDVLDSFEGSMYERVPVVAVTDSGSCDAHVYLLDEHCRSLLSAEPWSLDTFVDAHLNAFMSDYDGFVAVR